MTTTADTAEVVKTVEVECDPRPDSFVIAHLERNGIPPNLEPGYSWWYGTPNRTMADCELEIERHRRENGAIKHIIFRLPGEVVPAKSPVAEAAAERMDAGGPAVFTVNCRRCDKIVLARETVYHDSWEMLCHECCRKLGITVPLDDQSRRTTQSTAERLAANPLPEKP